mgnify:CR=1 FL=1
MGQGGLREDQFLSLSDSEKEEVVTNTAYSSDRYNVCKNCDKFTSLKTCSICFCFVPMKVFFKKTSCPLDKWGKIEE